MTTAKARVVLLFGGKRGANREIFATEIVRMIVGSIGLVLTVPITTAISAWMLVKRA